MEPHKGYDNDRVYGECDDRGVRPIVPLKSDRQAAPQVRFLPGPPPLSSETMESTAAAPVLAPVERLRLVRRAQMLAWASLLWMTAEGVIAVVAGIMAGSIALIGFGFDSAIEGIASVVIIWRFWGARALSEKAERRRKSWSPSSSSSSPRMWP